jgi:hypothetical protein
VGEAGHRPRYRGAHGEALNLVFRPRGSRNINRYCLDMRVLKWSRFGRHARHARVLDTFDYKCIEARVVKSHGGIGTRSRCCTRFLCMLCFAPSHVLGSGLNSIHPATSPSMLISLDIEAYGCLHVVGWGFDFFYRPHPPDHKKPRITHSMRPPSRTYHKIIIYGQLSNNFAH